MTCARSATACAGSCALDPRGAPCPTTCHPGTPSTSGPSAAIFDGRTLHGSVEDGDAGGYDDHRKRQGRTLHLELVVTPANEQERALAGGIRLEVVRLPESRTGFVVLPRRRVVGRGFTWLMRFQRLGRDSERLPETLAGLHLLALTTLMPGHMLMMKNGASVHVEIDCSECSTDVRMRT